MELEIIEKILPGKEAAAYLYLIKHAPKKASDVAKELGVTRPIVYSILDSLIEKGLVIKHKNQGSPTVFNPQHPLFVQEVLEHKEREIEAEKQSFASILPELTSQFHLRFGGVPGFKTYVGKKGMFELYDDILNEKQDILLIRSLEDRKHPETADMITPQMKEQVEAGIHVRSITPYHELIPKNYDGWYGSYNIEQRIISPDRLNLPAQIIVYANKVSMTSFGEVLVTTIIEDKHIHDTFTQIFEFLWAATKTDNDKYRKIVGEEHEYKEPLKWGPN